MADDTDADVTGQIHQILDKVEGLLAVAGSDVTKMLSATIWLPDISGYDEFNAVLDRLVAGRTCAGQGVCRIQIGGGAIFG